MEPIPLTKLEEAYIATTIPHQSCLCAIHKYGYTPAEIVHNNAEERKRLHAHKNPPKPKFDSSIPAEDELPARVDPHFAFHPKEGATRYGGVRELEQEILDGVTESSKYKLEEDICRVNGTIILDRNSSRKISNHSRNAH